MDSIITYLKENTETGRRTLSKLFNIPESKARQIVKKFKKDIFKKDDIFKLIFIDRCDKLNLIDDFKSILIAFR